MASPLHGGLPTLPFGKPTGGISEGNIHWSPDGTRAAFSSNAGNGTSRIYTMNANGTGLVAITDAGTSHAPKDWSPDSRHLLVESNRSLTEPIEIVVMGADGSDRRVVGQGVAQSWSPDGRKILYYDAGGGVSAKTMNVDGSGVRSLPAGMNGSPDWGPGSVDPDSTSSSSPKLSTETTIVAGPGFLPMPVPPQTSRSSSGAVTTTPTKSSPPGTIGTPSVGGINPFGTGRPEDVVFGRTEALGGISSSIGLDSDRTNGATSTRAPATALATGLMLFAACLTIRVRARSRAL